MIEIKCNERQKETIIKSLCMSGDCLFSWDVECMGGCLECIECMDKNIKWTIRGNEDAEEQGLLVKIDCRCRDCKHVDFAGCSNGSCYCYMNECYMNEDDFCKYAERYKEEAEQKLESMRKE